MKKISLAAFCLVLSLLCSCYAPGPQHPTPAERDAIVLITATNYETGWVRSWKGTGTYIASVRGSGIVVTAGHVCDGNPIATMYQDETGALLTPIYDHDTDADDVCLLVANGPAPAVIRVGTTSPVYGDDVSYAGYPDGIRGTYRGIAEGTEADGRILVSIPVYFGASGSVLLDRSGEAVGVMSTGDMRFQAHARFIGTAALYRAYRFGLDYLAELYSNPWGTVTNSLVGNIDRGI